MASFAVKSLLTNIPINETINIACDTLFDPDRQFETIFTKNYHELTQSCIVNFPLANRKRCFKRIAKRQ